MINERLELLKDKQLDNVNKNKKLKENDLIRITKFTDKCLFGNECVLWKGYVTNNKSKYINFYFNGSKTALHRLLYLNYIGNIYDNTYLSYKCQNPGICCNINHLIVKKKNKKNKIIKKNTVEFDL
tara:strand:+ start:582 stop:959 length:378 start_codon:yes stop_codon:yes gene_type:complete